MFGEHLIVLDAENFTWHGIEWPPKSQELNRWDFLLWGSIKDRIYKDYQDLLEHLKSAIRKETNFNILQRIMTEFQNRLSTTTVGGGRHFKDLLH